MGYVFEQKGWRRIPFNEIPEAIYTMNLSYLDNHDDNSRPLTLSEKEKHSTANVRDADTKSLMIHINPSYKFPNDEAYRH